MNKISRRLYLQALCPLKIILSFSVLFFLVQSCKKIDTKVAGSRSYTESFFEKPATSSVEVQAIIDLLKSENDKTGFVNSLPDNAGLPVWGKLIFEKPKPKPGYAARGVITDEKGNMLIPLSNNNKTLGALLFAIKKDGKYQFYCYNNNYAYNVANNKSYTTSHREKVMAMFIYMSNYVFGIHKFKNIPNDLFLSFKGKVTGETKSFNIRPVKEPNPETPIAGDLYPTTLCVEGAGYVFSGHCTCVNNPDPSSVAGCQDWTTGCSDCSDPGDHCETYWPQPVEDPENPGTTSTNTGVEAWANTLGSGGAGSNSENWLPNPTCSYNCSWFVGEAPEYEFETMLTIPQEFFNLNSESLPYGMGSKPIKEYSAENRCAGLKDMWDDYPDNEVAGVVTKDGKLIVIAVVDVEGGAFKGLFKYKNPITDLDEYFYTYPMSEGVPTLTYEGMSSNGINYFIPIAASVHTHSPCRTDGTNGVSHEVSDGDKKLASDFPTLKNWVIGCDAIAQFNNGDDFFDVHTGTISSLCSFIP